MAGAEVAIVAIGIEGIDAAIWALSSFAISMGLTFILKDAGFEFRQLTEGKKDDIPKMIEEIQENYPKIKEYMRNNHRPFLDYTISSNIGLYHDENLGDIHFFPGNINIKDIFASVGFKITPKEFIPEPEAFPINNDDIPKNMTHPTSETIDTGLAKNPPIFVPVDKDIPKNMPHPVNEPIDIGLAKNPPIFIPVDKDIPKNMPHPINEPIPKIIPTPVFLPHPNNNVIKINLSNISDVIKKIPKRLRINGGKYVNIDLFKKNGRKIKRKKAYKEKDGWIIDKDKANHGKQGKEQWKLKNEDGDKIATLGEDGKILRD